MRGLAAFENSALQARVERLRRSERDLHERIQMRIAQAESEDRWVPSDPIYQRLSFVLRHVRTEISDTEGEIVRRRKLIGSQGLVGA